MIGLIVYVLIALVFFVTSEFCVLRECRTKNRMINDKVYSPNHYNILLESVCFPIASLLAIRRR